MRLPKLERDTVRLTPLVTRGGMRLLYAMPDDLHATVMARLGMDTFAGGERLPGITNRHDFSVLAERELARSRRYRRPLSLVILALDQEEPVRQDAILPLDNLLPAVASIIQSLVRPPDVTARQDPCVFTILLPEAGLPAAHLLAERLRSAIASLRQAGPGGCPLLLTASLGVTGMEIGETCGFDELLTRAGIALETARRAGGNRVEVA